MDTPTLRAIIERGAADLLGRPLFRWNAGPDGIRTLQAQQLFWRNADEPTLQKLLAYYQTYTGASAMFEVEIVPYPVSATQSVGLPAPVGALGGVLGILLAGIFSGAGMLNWGSVFVWIAQNYALILKAVADVTSGTVSLKDKVDEIVALVKSALGI